MSNESIHVCIALNWILLFFIPFVCVSQNKTNKKNNYSISLIFIYWFCVAIWTLPFSCLWNCFWSTYTGIYSPHLSTSAWLWKQQLKCSWKETALLFSSVFHTFSVVTGRALWLPQSFLNVHMIKVISRQVSVQEISSRKQHSIHFLFCGGFLHLCCTTVPVKNTLELIFVDTEFKRYC